MLGKIKRTKNHHCFIKSSLIQRYLNFFGSCYLKLCLNYLLSPALKTVDALKLYLLWDFPYNYAYFNLFCLS